MEMDVSSSNNSTIKQEFNEELGNENGEISTKSDVLQDLKFEIEYESHPSKTDHKDEIFVCDFCGEFLHSQKALGDHELQCKIKCESVPSKSGTKDKELHIKDEIFLCEVCQESFRSEQDLEDHKLSHLAAEPEGDEDEAENAYVCSVCNDVFDSKKDLVEHKNSISECYEHRKCDKCGDGSAEEFSCIWELIDHVKDKHGLNVGDSRAKKAKPSHRLGNLEAKPAKRPRLTSSRSDRVVPNYTCNYCPEKFFFDSSRKIHQDTHLGDTQIHQDTHLGDTQIHQDTHLGDTQYFCSRCSLIFDDDLSRVVHEGSRHSGINKYFCNFCPRRFLRAHFRDVHEKTHGKETKTIRIRGSIL